MIYIYIYIYIYIWVIYTYVCVCMTYISTHPRVFFTKLRVSDMRTHEKTNTLMQVPALRILSGLLVRWAPNRQAFEDLQGYCVLLYILSQSELSFEVFEVLLDVSTRALDALGLP